MSDDRYWQILLQKSFWGDGQIFPGLLMRFARGDMRDHIVSQKNDYGALSAPRSIAAAESAKNQFLRDFRRRSIFGFCNNIGTLRRADEHQECLSIEVDRNGPTDGQSDAFDPERTRAVSFKLRI
jgi:hypothetical protein